MIPGHLLPHMLGVLITGIVCVAGNSDLGTIVSSEQVYAPDVVHDPSAIEEDAVWGNPLVPISEEASSAGGYANSHCEPVTVPICKGMFYEHTRMPNMFNHETQEEAGLEVSFAIDRDRVIIVSNLL